MNYENKRMAIYARCSTTRDQKTEVQTEVLKRFCLARGWAVAEIIEDSGYSGGSDDRPGLRRLMKLAKSREIDGVIVVKLDRLFRSLTHLVNTLDLLQSLDVTFVATHDNVDYSTPAGRMLVQIMGSLAEFEKNLIRERTLIGLDHAREAGKVFGRPFSGDYGKILELKKQGYTYSQIQEELGVSKGTVWRALRSAPKSLPEIISQANRLGVDGDENRNHP